MKRKEFLGTVAALAAGTIAVRAADRPTTAALAAESAWPPVNPDDERFWSFVRDQFPLNRERAYFNTGGLGASPYTVIDAVKSKMDELERTSETGYDEGLLNGIRTSAGALLGCDAGELAFVRNTTEGINIVANGLPLRRGDEVITTTHEHIGNSLTWIGLQKRDGIVPRFFEPSVLSQQENLDRIERLLTSKTRLISIPHAVTTTGLVLPVKEIGALARTRKLWFFVDGAQTAGMFPFNLHEIGCDAYATSGHKWLLGPKETGLLYVRKESLDAVQAKAIGAYSADSFDFLKGTMTFHPTARRYEYGTVSIPLRVGLGAAVDFIRRIGIENVWKRDQALSSRLLGELQKLPNVKIVSPSDDAMRSAMVTFMHEKVPYLELMERLAAVNLRTRPVSEGGMAALRISTHIYNTYEEVEKLVEAVRKQS